MRIEVRGLKEVRQYLKRVGKDMTGQPMIRAMRDVTLLLTRDARRNAPVDTGTLRSSIMPSVAVQHKEVIGIVGSNVEYAPFMELGTKPHFPPPDALEVWARRHGFSSAYLVCRAISRRGLKARKFLQKAMKTNARRIVNRINQAIKEIIR